MKKILVLHQDRKDFLLRVGLKQRTVLHVFQWCAST